MVLITHRGEEMPDEATRLVAVKDMQIGRWREGGKERESEGREY